MSRIRSSRTQPELRLKKVLEEAGIPFKYQAKVGGVRVDFLVPPRLVVEVRGCFWHRCPKHYREPKSNVEFWRKHIGDSVRRDRLTRRMLGKLGYRVLVLWEHDLKRPEACLHRVENALKAVRRI